MKEIGGKPQKLSWGKRIIGATVGSLAFGLALVLLDYIWDQGIQRWEQYAVYSGVIFFLLFVLPYLIRKGAQRFNDRLSLKMTVELDPNETLKYGGPANLYSGLIAVGGRLFLTDKRLIFKPHSLNVQNSIHSLLYSDIASARRLASFGWLNNRIVVKTKKGEKYRFRVNDRARWISKIKKGKDGRYQVS